MSRLYRHHLPRLLAEQGIEPRGVLHVGAHRGEEVPVYRKLGFRRIVLAEPNPALREHLLTLGCEVASCAVGTPGRRSFFLTRQPTRSSLLRPTGHVPGAEVERSVAVETRALAEFVALDLNVLAIDAQGAELEIIQSGPVSAFELVIVECRSGRHYHGQPTPTEVRAHLEAEGMRLIHTQRYRRVAVEDLVFVR